MGRKKIKIEKIEHPRQKQVSWFAFAKTWANDSFFTRRNKIAKFYFLTTFLNKQLLHLLLGLLLKTQARPAEKGDGIDPTDWLIPCCDPLWRAGKAHNLFPEPRYLPRIQLIDGNFAWKVSSARRKFKRTRALFRFIPIIIKISLTNQIYIIFIWSVGYPDLVP